MRLDIVFVAGECNGLFKLSIGDRAFGDIVEGENTISIDVGSGDLELRFTGKDNRRDTQVANGEIIRDKFIDIQSIDISGFKLERYHIYHHFFDPYISRDSTQKISLPDPMDLLHWYTRILEKHATTNQC